MIGFILMLAASTGEHPKIPKLLHSGKDLYYPKDALEKGTESMVRVQVTLAPNGKPIHCDILISSGSPDLDEAGCKFFVTSKFAAARDENGKPAYGVINISRLFIAKDSIVTSPSADLSLAVNHLPKGAGQSVSRLAAVTIDATGKATSCYTEPDELNAPLDKAVCEIAQHRLTFKPALNEEGAPIASIQQFQVGFTASDSPLLLHQKSTMRRPLN